MSTNYPGGVDQFNEPSQPESTALSQVGAQATPGRNHVEHHRDLGDAVQALQSYAAQRGHNHSGDSNDPTKGGKLAQVNTHEGADTDTAATAIHHTLGTGGYQAAPGNHTHDYDSGSILNAPYIRCTSSTRPASPTSGLTIYETDTNRMRVWTNFGNGDRWNFNYFNPASKTSIVVAEPGLYQIDAALQWSVNFIPEIATVVFCVNGQETILRNSGLQSRPGLLSLLGVVVNPDFSQTLAISGKLRVNIGDTISMKCRYGGSAIGGVIQTYFDLASRVKSRLEMHYVGP